MSFKSIPKIVLKYNFCFSTTIHILKVVYIFNKILIILDANPKCINKIKIIDYIWI